MTGTFPIIAYFLFFLTIEKRHTTRSSGTLAVGDDDSLNGQGKVEEEDGKVESVESLEIQPEPAHAHHLPRHESATYRR